MMGKETFTSDAAQRFIKRMTDALEAKPMTRSEMESALFASKTKVLNYIRCLHGGDEKRIYVCGYDELPTGGRNPRYAVGNLPDAPPLGTRTNAQRWAIIKSDPEKHEARKEMLRGYARKKGIQPRARSINAIERNESEVHDREKKKRRIRARLAKLRAKPANIFSALGL